MARTKGAAGKKNAGITTGVAHNAHDVYVKELEDKLAMYEARQLDSGEEVDVSISPTEYVKVMSLLPYRLNLCTKERGQGKVYKFDKIFQVKKIIYSDLVDIMEVSRGFLESGYYIILNPRVVRANGLDEIYDKTLTKEKMEEILGNTSESVSLYTSASETQKLVILDIMVQKLVEDPGAIDLNLVDKISRISNINISQKAEDMRQLSLLAVEETK